MNAMNVKTAIDKDQLIQIFCDFLSAIGIEAREGEVTGKTFVPGIVIREGQIIFDREEMLYPGDMLHEAGHIAVVPSAERRSLNENVIANRPGHDGDEIAAMLWSYAACVKMKIPAEIVFHEQGYKGDSQWLLENYRSGKFIGMPLFEWMGMA